MIDINSYRHEKEKTYYSVCLVFGIISWCVLFLITFGMVIFYGLFMALILYIMQQFFHAKLYGNAVKVSETQYSEIFNIIKNCCEELSIHKIPNTFIVNGQGIVNAVAVKFLSKKYVLLYSDLTDLMLKRKQMNELKMIIAHELAHHAAGHTSLKRNLPIWPSKIIPFLGTAYSRACELTCDRIGHKMTEDHFASQRALISIASGSEALASEVDIESFKKQEHEISPFFGFLYEIFSTHPRMTQRVLELERFK
jgi:Zn-dependent protease with chaperone function